jgi:hypothetical protein
MILFVSLLWVNIVSASGLTDVRMTYFNAAADVTKMNAFWQKIEQYPKKDHIYYCYLAAYKGLESKNQTSLQKKIKLFNEFKSNIHKSFELKDSFDARFVRYCVQNGTPSILGYKDQMAEDKKYLINNLPLQTHTEYVKKVKAFLNNCSDLTKTEKEKVNKL